MKKIKVIKNETINKDCLYIVRLGNTFKTFKTAELTLSENNLFFDFCYGIGIVIKEEDIKVLSWIITAKDKHIYIETDFLLLEVIITI